MNIEEVRLQNPTYKNCEKYSYDKFKKVTFDEIVKDQTCVQSLFIVKDLDLIKKDVEDLYNELPINVPFEYSLKSRLVEIKTPLINNNIIYDNYISISNGFGDLYFVEEQIG